jgi:hypothetical protein
MLGRVRARLTYANVTATVALFLAIASLATVAKNLIYGKSSANSAGATAVLAGSSNELPSCSSCEVSIPASGTGSFGTLNNSANEQLSPNTTIVASDLSVHVDTAPGSATRKFFLWYRSETSHFLTCEISGSNTTCNSGAQTLTIPPGSRVLVESANFGGAPTTRVQLGWLATAQ